MVKIAVVGALTNTGREILSLMAENNIPAGDIYALDHKCPLGTLESYGEDDEIDVFNAEDFNKADVDVAIFATDEELTKKYMKKSVFKNAKIIDCSGAVLTDEKVPMIVSGLNDTLLQDKNLKVVGVPSAVTTQILAPLAKVNEIYPLTRIVASAYLATSFYGKEGMDELFNQTRKIYMNTTLVDDEQVFQKQIAFNVLPQVGEFIGEETKNEWLVNAEIKKVLGGNMKVHLNAAFVPAFIGAGLFVNVECAKAIDLDEVKALMSKTEGTVVFDKQTDGGYVSMNDVQGENDIYISRIRQDLSCQNGFSFWAVADDLRADVASNTFNVMKLMLKK